MPQRQMTNLINNAIVKKLKMASADLFMRCKAKNIQFLKKSPPGERKQVTKDKYLVSFSKKR